MPEGRQSPPPERQTGAQLNDVPGSGKGTDQSASKDEVKDSLNNLESNPKEMMSDALKDKFAKSQN